MESQRGEMVLVSASMAVQRKALEAAAEAHVALAHASFDNVEQAAQAAPRAMLFDLDAPPTKAAVLQLRANTGLATVPIIGIARNIDEIAFQEIFWWGMDDLANLTTARGLTTRIRALGNLPLEPPMTASGVAVIEGAEQAFRVRMARVFANTLHSIRFALSVDEAVAESEKERVSVVVSAAPKDPDAPLSVVAARGRGVDVPWLVGAPPRDQARLRRALAGVDRVGVFDTYGAPENALYHANELSRSNGIESRRASRILYSTVARFRNAGGDEDDFGLTYNVSSTGLYIRTLAPLPAGTDVWLELRPPRTERTVRLHGRVVWARPFGPNHRAVIPPGMGVHLVGDDPDVGAYQHGVNVYAEAHGYLAPGGAGPAGAPL